MKFSQDINLLKNSCGIYMIFNKINNKKYIGSTSNNFYQRWYQHINNLNKNTHYNKFLQLSWNKYSENNFKFIIINIINKINDNTLFKKIIFDNEQKYLDLYDCYKPYGYNLKSVNSPCSYKYYLSKDDIYNCKYCLFYNKEHLNSYKTLYFCELYCTNDDFYNGICNNFSVLDMNNFNDDYDNVEYYNEEYYGFS
jgi:group I intron endonuclease